MSKSSQRKLSYYQLGYADADNDYYDRLLRRRHIKDYAEGFQKRLDEKRVGKNQGLISKIRKRFLGKP